MSDIPNHMIEIDGFPFYAEDVKPVEKYQRRKFLRTPIFNGSEFISRGPFVPREFSFTGDIDHKLGRPDQHDDVFSAMNNNICRVVSRHFGGSFNAEIHITPTPQTPTTLRLEVKVLEVAKINVKV